jgi:hypothetical protein
MLYTRRPSGRGRKPLDPCSSLSGVYPRHSGPVYSPLDQARPSRSGLRLGASRNGGEKASSHGRGTMPAPNPSSKDRLRFRDWHRPRGFHAPRLRVADVERRRTERPRTPRGGDACASGTSPSIGADAAERSGNASEKPASTPLRRRARNLSLSAKGRLRLSRFADPAAARCVDRLRAGDVERRFDAMPDYAAGGRRPHAPALEERLRRAA